MDQILRPKQEYTRVVIDADKRDNKTTTTTTNFTYTLDRKIDRVKIIRLASVQIPFTYYAVNATNNIAEVTAGTGAVAPGNYTAGTFATALKTTLDAIGGGPYTVTYSNSTHKLTIAAAGAFAVLTSAANNIAPILGFTVDSAVATSNVGDSVLCLHGPNYLLLRSNLLTQYASSPSATASSEDGKNILCAIPTKGNPTDIIIHEPIDAQFELNLKQTYQNDIDFILEDDKGNVLDLNKKPWSAQFIFQTE